LEQDSTDGNTVDCEKRILITNYTLGIFLERRCIHEIHYQILSLCKREPTSVAEIYKKLKLKYPDICHHLNGLVTLEHLDVVNMDGSPAFVGKRQYQMIGKDTTMMKVTYHRYNPLDFSFAITPLGRQILDNYDRFFEIQSQITRIILSTLRYPKVSLKPMRRRRKLKKPISEKMTPLRYFVNA
jgi:hypothetical protein